MLTLQDLLRTRTSQPPLNKALYFNGVNAYISVNLSYQFTAITILALVNFPNSSYGSTCIRGAGTGTTRDWDFGVGGTTFWWTLTDGATIKDLTSDFSTYINKWAVIWGRYDGSVMSMGINDKQTNSTSFKANLNQGINNPTFMMCRKSPVYPSSDYKQGYLASILIYSRALSASEIVYNMSNPNNPIRDGLVLWFDARACDASKNICWDLSGNGNHGTMYNVQIVTLSTPVRVGGSL
jgi:hypothetical protein